MGKQKEGDEAGSIRVELSSSEGDSDNDHPRKRRRTKRKEEQRKARGRVDPEVHLPDTVGQKEGTLDGGEEKTRVREGMPEEGRNLEWNGRFQKVG